MLRKLPTKSLLSQRMHLFSLPTPTGSFTSRGQPLCLSDQSVLQQRSLSEGRELRPENWRDRYGLRLTLPDGEDTPISVTAVIRDLISDLLGPARPKGRGRSFSYENIKTAERFKAARPSGGFLVRGVLYDMSALMLSGQALQKAEELGALQSDLDKLAGPEGGPRTRAWGVEGEGNLGLTRQLDEGYLIAEQEGGSKVGVSTAEVRDSVAGYFHGTGLALADGGRPELGLLKSQQQHPELLGQTLPESNQEQGARKISGNNAKQQKETGSHRAGDIRGKYENKMRMIKARAALQDADKGAIGGTSLSGTASGPVTRAWNVLPGAAEMLRHLQERGLAQGLLVSRACASEQVSVVDQLGRFPFRPITQVQVDRGAGNSREAASEFFSEQVLKRTCADWGLPVSQVMVVVGPSKESANILQTVGSAGCYLCRIAPYGIADDPESTSGRSEMHPANPSQGKEHARAGSLLKKLASFLVVDELQGDNVRSRGSVHAHFVARDIREFKHIMEDLNGVSYRKSTMIKGLDSGRDRALAAAS